MRKHEVLGLMEEDCHLVTLRLGLQRFSTVPILRMVRTSPDRLRLAATVISTNRHPISRWISAAVAASLTRRGAADGPAGGDVGEGHVLGNGPFEAFLLPKENAII